MSPLHTDYTYMMADSTDKADKALCRKVILARTAMEADILNQGNTVC